MSKKNLIFLFMNFMTVLCLLSITGCGETPHSNLAMGDLADLQDISSPNPDSTNPTWYVSSSGNDTDDNTGTEPARPLASVRAALDRIKLAYRGGGWKTGTSAVIMIRGTINGSSSFDSNNSMVDISGAGSYPPIILEGDPVRGGTLNARRNEYNDGRVLYIDGNKVTLGSRLTLTGGYALMGGAVCVGSANSSSEGEFIMAGGDINGNTAVFGGAVWVYKGKMTMTGGVIRYNSTTKHNGAMGSGGGVYVNASASFSISGGTIRNNGGAETDKGGGVFVDGKGLFTMSGGEVRSNNSFTQGGGVQIASSGEFTMSGGSISSNRTGKFGGGGVYAAENAKFTNTGGTISGNTPAP
jgi:hypothetical protein